MNLSDKNNNTKFRKYTKKDLPFIKFNLQMINNKSANDKQRIYNL